MDGTSGSYVGVPKPYQMVRQNDVELQPQRRSTSLSSNIPVRRKLLPRVVSDSDYGRPVDVWLDADPTISRDEVLHTSDQAAIWSSGSWKRLPVLAVLSLIGVLLCTVASIVVLVLSDGTDVQRWHSSSPSVYLAIFSVIANTLLGFALADGLVISFWLSLLEGCTMSELNRNWQCGNSLWPAFRQGFRRGGRVTAVARIIALIALFRSPLYQRASTINPNHTVENASGTTELHIAQRLPDGYSGISVYSRVAGTQETALLTPAFVDIMNDFATHSNMTMDGDVCSAVCATTVKGFGFKSECSLTETFIDYGLLSPGGRYIFDTSVQLFKITDNPADVATFFAGLQVNGTFNSGRNSVVNTETTTKVLLTSHICNLTAGIVEYNIKLTQNTVTLSSRNEDRFLEAIDLLSPRYTGGNTTIGGFQYASDYTFRANAYYDFAGAVSSTILTGAIANQMLNSTTSSSGYLSFNDPMDLMLNGLREIAFRASLKVGKENVTMDGVKQNVDYISYGTYSVYRTDYPYLILAVLITVAGIISVVATFYGWWRLGRNTSMNPLEIGKAFRAPILADAGSNVSFDAYPAYLKNSRIKYGSVPSAASAGASGLAIGGVEEVRPPQARCMYDK